MKSLEISPLAMPAHRIPWTWTYVLFLERRWEQIQEISAMYGDEDALGIDKEMPKEFWHDSKRVDEWIERRKKKRKEEQEAR